jgi:hypothetical protein
MVNVRNQAWTHCVAKPFGQPIDYPFAPRRRRIIRSIAMLRVARPSAERLPLHPSGQCAGFSKLGRKEQRPRHIALATRTRAALRPRLVTGAHVIALSGSLSFGRSAPSPAKA